jgi:hypothetical protein
VNAQNISRFKVLTVAVLWTTTFAFVYNTTTQVRADSVMLLLMAAAYWASVNRVSYVVLCIIMVAGVLAHEIILIFIPALWLDKVFKANGTGGNLYPAWQLAAVTVVAVVAYVVSRKVIPVLPATEVNYWSDPLKIVSHALQYSGGVVKHLLRIYAAYGPVLVYAFFFVATQPGPKILASLGLFLLAVGATFLATDTLRVMTVMFVPLLVLATDYIGRIHQTQSRFLAWSLILLQVLYTYVVFGHLRTFEHSDMLNIVAGILSIAAFIMCVYLAYKTNLSTRLMKSRSS